MKNQTYRMTMLFDFYGWIADGWKEYELLDCGSGEKLERWGDRLLVRRPRRGRRSKSPCENFLFPLDIPNEISYDKQACKAQSLYTEEGAP